MRLWLDDIREPWKHGFLSSEWAHTAEQAIEMLKTGEVTFASLDHDLAPEHYVSAAGCDLCPNCNKACELLGEMTGCDVVLWMEANNVWPRDGVVVHSMNQVGKARMEEVIKRNAKKQT